MFGADGILYALGAAVFVALVAFIKGRMDGRTAERNRNRAEDADAYEKHLKELETAAAARNRVQPGRVPDDDKYRRD